MPEARVIPLRPDDDEPRTSPSAAVSWEEQVAEVLDFLRRRLSGEYETDEFGYTPRYTTEAALIDYARTVSPVVSARLVDAVTSRLRGAVERVGDAADAVGERLRPAPPAPGLRAVRDA